jgi:hypothetical protein
MLPASSNGEADQAEDSFFASLAGDGRQRKPAAEKRNPDELQISSREINQQFVQGKHIDDYEDHRASEKVKPGGPGSQWRMMKLRRTYEAAEEEGKDVEEVAIERYGSLEAFNEARSERQYLDDRQGSRGGASAVSSTSSSRMPSRQSSFRRPGASVGASSNASSPKPSAHTRLERFKQSGFESETSKPSTPIPSVFTPQMMKSTYVDQAAVKSQSDAEVSGPALDSASLNKLSARVLRAELLGSTEAPALRAHFEREKARSEGGGDRGLADEHLADHRVGNDRDGHIQVLPTLDARGRLYDTGKGDVAEASTPLAGNRQKRTERKFETRDGRTGEMVRYNADDDEHTLADLVREERFGAGSASQKNMDAQLAERIASDRSYRNDLDYKDENVERLARRKMKSDAMKRMFAVQDYAKTKKALDTCSFCSQDERPPRANIVSSGTRCFLALPDHAPLVEGHCLLVPMQHHLSILEADEDTFEEMKNFMKCLIQKANSEGKSVLFVETVTSLRQQRHTYVEAIPVEQAMFTQLPIYFRQAILDVSDEWSQNKRLIEFSQQRPFRRSMVADLPYFMVQWDHKGERGYGHVIEHGDNNGVGGGDEGDGWGLEDQARSSKSGEFPRYFASQIIGNLLEYEPHTWRKPRRLDSDQRSALRSKFNQRWSKYDWTKMLDQT